MVGTECAKSIVHSEDSPVILLGFFHLFAGKAEEDAQAGAWSCWVFYFTKKFPCCMWNNVGRGVRVAERGVFNTAGPGMNSLCSASFHDDVDEMPQALNPCLGQLALWRNWLHYAHCTTVPRTYQRR